MSVRLLTASSVLCLASALAPGGSAQTLTAPAQLSPRGAITQPRPFYQWRPVAGATRYDLLVNGPSGAPVIQAPFVATATCDTNVCTARPAVDLAAGAHQWRVTAANAAGSGPASPLLAFTITLGGPTATPVPTLTPTPTRTPNPTLGTTFVTTLLPEGGAITTATGSSTLILAPDERSARVSATFSGLTTTQTASHVHGIADPGQTAPVLFSVPMGVFNDAVWVFQDTGNVTALQQVEALKAGRIYINIHSERYPSGEIRGHYRVVSPPTPTPTAGPSPTPTPTATAGPLTIADAVHFLQQASWGANAASIERVRTLGYAGWIDEQLALAPSTYSAAIQAAPTTNDDDRIRAFQARFFRNALSGEDQLRQRVGWALSQIFVVSGTTIEDGPGMAFYVDMLNRNASTTYRQLLIELTLNPAMGDYLDMVNNVRPRRGRIANENYAREILQLFSIGLFKLNPNGSLVLDAQGKPIPTYDQAVIEGLARVFTGWTYAPQPGQPNNPRNPRNYLAPMVVHQTNHDVEAKTILNGVVLPAGRDGTTDLNQALLVIVQHPNVAPFIGRQLIQHLVTSNPSPAYVARVSAVFNNNGTGVRGDLRAVVKAILLDPEARTNTAPPFGKLKEPALAMLQLLRALGGVGDGLGLPGIARNMGQDPFRAPTVFSYYQPDYQLPGTTLIAPPFQIFSEATVVNRANWINTVIFGTVGVPFGPTGTSVAVDLAPLQAIAGDPVALVDRLNLILMHGRMSPAAKSTIVETVRQIAASRTRQRVQNAVYLVASSAQFNVGR